MTTVPTTFEEMVYSLSNATAELSIPPEIHNRFSYLNALSKYMFSDAAAALDAVRETYATKKDPAASKLCATLAVLPLSALERITAFQHLAKIVVANATASQPALMSTQLSEVLQRFTAQNLPHAESIHVHTTGNIKNSLSRMLSWYKLCFGEVLDDVELIIAANRWQEQEVIAANVKLSPFQTYLFKVLNADNITLGTSRITLSTFTSADTGYMPTYNTFAPFIDNMFDLPSCDKYAERFFPSEHIATFKSIIAQKSDTDYASLYGDVWTKYTEVSALLSQNRHLHRDIPYLWQESDAASATPTAYCLVRYNTVEIPFNQCLLGAAKSRYRYVPLQIMDGQQTQAIEDGSAYEAYYATVHPLKCKEWRVGTRTDFEAYGKYADGLKAIDVILCNIFGRWAPYAKSILSNTLKTPFEKQRAIVFINATSGCGKDIIFGHTMLGTREGLLEALTHPQFISVMTMQSLLGSYSKGAFGGILYIPEAAIRKDGRDGANTLKDIITNPVIDINEKYKAIKQVRSPGLCVFASNELPFQAVDGMARRILPIYHSNSTRMLSSTDVDFAIKFWQDPENQPIIYEWLTAHTDQIPQLDIHNSPEMGRFVRDSDYHYDQFRDKIIDAIDLALSDTRVNNTVIFTAPSGARIISLSHLRRETAASTLGNVAFSRILALLSSDTTLADIVADSYENIKKMAIHIGQTDMYQHKGVKLKNWIELTLK